LFFFKILIFFGAFLQKNNGKIPITKTEIKSPNFTVFFVIKMITKLSKVIKIKRIKKNNLFGFFYYKQFVFKLKKGGNKNKNKKR
jgi:hypothetical protein